MKNNNVQNDKNLGFSWPVQVGSVAIIGAGLVYLLNFYGFKLSDSPADWGAFGSYFGGVVGPILAFLSLLLVIATLRVQHTSLQAARVQMEANKEEFEANNRSNARADFLRRFELEEKNLQSLALDTVKALLVDIRLQENEEQDAEKEYFKLLDEYSRGAGNVFINYLKRYLAISEDPEKLDKLFKYADGPDGLMLEQYVLRFERMLEEAPKHGRDIEKIVNSTATGKLYKVMKPRYDQELKRQKQNKV
ncbi:hypothetical protein [Salinimonas chungwhensis]|uniref:hypothetical protein n=1 Tax=Salinimonas chungwhensis TaxID=265425 RepID=UPI0003718040|nr:hypothetical protein [Salinimonas chungwhensis]